MKKPLSRNFCLSCTAKKRGCCFGYYISLTMKDIKNIEKLGYQLEKVITAQDFTKAELDGCHGWQDNAILINKKYYTITLRKKNDVCIFLSHKQGCLLGKNRPLECKTYPFWLNKKNQIIYQDRYCYMLKHKIPVKQGLTIMGESEKEVRSYFKEIRNDYLKNQKKQKAIILNLLKK